MPILKRKHDYTKIYRPNGTRFASGRTVPSVAEAVDTAFLEFIKEFGADYAQEEMVVEVLGVTGGWCATVVEVKEPGDPFERRSGGLRDFPDERK